MNSKLTLSVPESMIVLAKRLASSRNTTVSALFTESIREWAAQSPADPPASMESASTDLRSLMGALQKQPAFDGRSARIREKHG
jgi:hypothetical protein